MTIFHSYVSLPEGITIYIKSSPLNINTHDGSMVLLYMVTWIPSIYPLYVSIYTSAMDPMGYDVPRCSKMFLDVPPGAFAKTPRLERTTARWTSPRDLCTCIDAEPWEAAGLVGNPWKSPFFGLEELGGIIEKSGIFHGIFPDAMFDYQRVHD